MRLETFAVIFLILISLLAGTVIGFSAHEKEVLHLRFKCVEMREMPLGACSRLFGEGK